MEILRLLKILGFPCSDLQHYVNLNSLEKAAAQQQAAKIAEHEPSNVDVASTLHASDSTISLEK